MRSKALVDRGGSGHKRICRCGAVVFSSLGWNASATWRIENPDGTWHDCPSLQPPDTCECVCGKSIVRYPDGRRYDLDGCAPHACKRQAPKIEKPAPLAVKPIPQHWHVSKVKIERRGGNGGI